MHAAEDMGPYVHYFPHMLYAPVGKHQKKIKKNTRFPVQLAISADRCLGQFLLRDEKNV